MCIRAAELMMRPRRIRNRKEFVRAAQGMTVTMIEEGGRYPRFAVDRPMYAHDIWPARRMGRCIVLIAHRPRNATESWWARHYGISDA